MAEAAITRNRSGAAALLRVGRQIGAGAGSGVGAALIGSGAGWIVAWALTFAGYDYVSLPSVVARVLAAVVVIAGGITLARLDLVPLSVGSGALVGGPVALMFGAVSLAGFQWALVLGIVAGTLGGLAAFTQAPTLTRRELGSYFGSPVVYIVATVFLALFGFFFYLGLARPGEVEASLQGPIWVVTMYILPMLAPVLTMRLLAEEKRSGTLEVLMTAPVRDWEVVLSKFLGAVAAFLVIVAPTLIHVLALYLVSERGPATAPLIGHYLGLLLTACLFLSLGLLGSSLSRDQIVAAIVGFGFSFGVFLLSVLQSFAERGDWFRQNESAAAFLERIANALKAFLEFVIDSVAYFRHMERFSEGVIDSRGITYFVSFTVLVLFLTVRVVESRKWR